jgi:hypothetical protein
VPSEYEIDIIRKDKEVRHLRAFRKEITWNGEQQYQILYNDITKYKQTEDERNRLIRKLKKALFEVRTLSGLLPICASCKKIRDDKGYWSKLESYISDHS